GCGDQVFFFQAADGIRFRTVTGVQTCALPICYQFQMHVNGQSRTGYLLALTAALVGRIAGHPIALSWRGWLQQRYFPRKESWLRSEERRVGKEWRSRGWR